MRTYLRSKVTLLFMTCAVILFVFPAIASAQGAPTIQSDKADYAPGELVTLTGSGWVPGETVRINVNDDAGQTWSRTQDVTADASGNISDSFNLPDWFVATYTVTATGASGTATTSFTDGNLTLKTDGVTGNLSGFSTARFTGNSNCTGTPNQNNSNVTANSTGNNLGGVDAGQSMRITAPSPVSSNTLKFTSWSGAVSSTNNPVCVPGSAANQTITANYSRITSTALQSNDTSTTYGDNVTFTATVTAIGGNPSGVGTVDFKDDSTVICNDVALASGGNTATCQTSSLGAGDHSITAEYSGTTGTAPRWAASSSSALMQSVSKASTATTVTCPASGVTYDGSAHEPCSATVTGAGGLDEPLTVTYQNNTNAGQATATATYAESANHLGSSDSETFTIDKATTTTVTCDPGPFTYDGSAHEPCSASVTGAGGLNEPVNVTYQNNVNAGQATASATYAESANHLGSSDSETFTIDKATTTTTVSCTAGPFTYNGSAHTPCSASVSGPNNLNEQLTVSYSNNVGAGTATASASFAETANYNGSSDEETFQIGKAATTTTVTCPASVAYTGSALTPCSATVTGDGGLNESVNVTYQNNTGPGQATANATYAESANHLSSSDSETFQITQPCEWSRVLQPVNQVSSASSLGISAYKQGSRGVVPVKFQLTCNGDLVSTPEEAADIGDVTRSLKRLV